MQNFLGEPLKYDQEFLEQLAYPNIFPTGKYGRDHPRGHKLSLTQYIHNRMRNKDRRYQKPEYLFHLANHQDMKTVLSAMNFTAKKTKKHTDQDLFNAIINQDEHFDARINSLFPELRSHDAYWRKRKLELEEMTKYEKFNF